MNNYKDILAGIDPSISNESLADSVVEKTQIIKRRSFRNTIVVMAVVVALAGFTITAGAVSGWDYSVFARYFFGGSQIVAEGMHDEINYTIVENTFENLSFEVTGLYADNMTIMLSIEVSSDEPVFNDDYSFNLWPEPNRVIFDHSLEKWVKCQWEQSSTFDSQYKRTILYKLYYIDEEIIEGNEYSINFPRAEFFSDPDSSGNHFLQRRVEIRFAIDKLALMNSISASPDFLLDNGNVLNEVRVNPFNIFIIADGQTHFGNDVCDYLSLVDADGNEIKLHDSWYDIFDKDGRLLRFKYVDGIIVVLPLLDPFPTVYTGPIYDEAGNEIIYLYRGVSTMSEDTQKSLKVEILAYNVFDVRDISAIILYGEKIPLR